VPNIHEVGRVGFVELSDSRANIKIQQGNQVATMPRETSVAEVADQVEDAVVTGPSGVIGAEALERQTALHLTSLAGCRLEVARKRRITLDAVVAGRMTLRWTILPTGLTGETEVVAREPVDPQVVDCIKRRMSLWEFSHPRGGPVRVARVLTLPDAVRTAK
jgi:hypothetical protein